MSREVFDEFAFKFAELFGIGVVANRVAGEPGVRIVSLVEEKSVHYRLLTQERRRRIEIN